MTTRTMARAYPAARPLRPNDPRRRAMRAACRAAAVRRLILEAS